MSRRVLVVEDDDELRFLWIDALESNGYAVVGVNDGALALIEIARFEPDLILLDLIMPRAEMDGLALLSRFTAIPALARVPIVVVSGLGEPLLTAIEPETAGALSIAGVVQKPVDIRSLLVNIEKLFPAAPNPAA